MQQLQVSKKSSPVGSVMGDWVVSLYGPDTVACTSSDLKRELSGTVKHFTPVHIHAVQTSRLQQQRDLLKLLHKANWLGHVRWRRWVNL